MWIVTGGLLASRLITELLFDWKLWPSLVKSLTTAATNSCTAALGSAFCSVVGTVFADRITPASDKPLITAAETARSGLVRSGMETGNGINEVVSSWVSSAVVELPVMGYLSSSTGCVRSARGVAWTVPLFAGTCCEVKEWVELDLLALMLVVLPCVALVPLLWHCFPWVIILTELSSELKVTRQNLSNDEKTGPVKQTLPMWNKGASNNRQRGWNGIADQQSWSPGHSLKQR